MTYRDRREARAERLRDWAEKRDSKAESAYQAARATADMIPLGQPILVGHYSQKSDTNRRNRMAANFDRSFEHAQKASDMRSRADNIESAAANAIYSDDPDAIERLQEKIAGLEAERARLKAFNASCRKTKGQGDRSLLDDAQRAGLESIERVCAYQLGKFGEMPTYASSNISGNLSRLRKRLEQLEGRAALNDLAGDELDAIIDHFGGAS
jgi:hypothetical protein